MQSYVQKLEAFEMNDKLHKHKGAIILTEVFHFKPAVFTTRLGGNFLTCPTFKFVVSSRYIITIILIDLFTLFFFLHWQIVLFLPLSVSSNHASAFSHPCFHVTRQKIVKCVGDITFKNCLVLKAQVIRVLRQFLPLRNYFSNFVYFYFSQYNTFRCYISSYLIQSTHFTKCAVLSASK